MELTTSFSDLLILVQNAEFKLKQVVNHVHNQTKSIQTLKHQEYTNRTIKFAFFSIFLPINHVHTKTVMNCSLLDTLDQKHKSITSI